MMFFKKKREERGNPADPRKSEEKMEGGRRATDGTNPYLSGRRTWNAHISSQVREKYMWLAVAIISLMIAFTSVGGIVYVGSKSKFIPYLVEVDKLGQVSWQGPIETISNIDPRIIKATLRTFISEARMVTPDVIVQKKSIYSVYAHIAHNTPAITKMNEFYNGTPRSSPFKRAKKEMVSVKIISVIPQSSDTWQVDWEETTRDRSGRIIHRPRSWRAMVTVFTTPTIGQKEEQIQKNPLGIYVKDFTWSRILGGNVIKEEEEEK